MVEPLESGINWMMDLGVIQKLDINEATDWCHLVLVCKPNGKSRVCLDPITINKALRFNIHNANTFQSHSKNHTRWMAWIWQWIANWWQTLLPAPVQTAHYRWNHIFPEQDCSLRHGFLDKMHDNHIGIELGFHMVMHMLRRLWALLVNYMKGAKM